MWSSFIACSWQCPLHGIFFQKIAFFHHDVIDHNMSISFTLRYLTVPCPHLLYSEHIHLFPLLSKQTSRSRHNYRRTFISKVLIHFSWVFYSHVHINICCYWSYNCFHQTDFQTSWYVMAFPEYLERYMNSYRRMAYVKSKWPCDRLRHVIMKGQGHRSWPQYA